MVKYTRRFVRRLLIASIPLLGVATDAGAATKEWIGTVGNWTSNHFWLPFGMPQDFDDVQMRTFDATHRAVTYNVNDGLFHIYGDMLVQSPGTGGIEFRTGGHDLELDTLTVSGSSTGNALYDIFGGSTFVNTATFGFNGLLHLNGSSVFQVTNFTQHGGFVSASPGSRLEVNGTYTLNDGGVQGAVRSSGTVVINHPNFGATLENHGTLVFNSPTWPLFFRGLDNSGTLVFNTRSVLFEDQVINRVSNTLPADKTIQLEGGFAHTGGTFTQLGWVTDDIPLGEPSHLSVAGGTWLQATNEFTGTSVASISIGSGGNSGLSAGPGTYVLNSGPLRTNALNVGVTSDGTFVQSGSFAFVGMLNLSAGSAAYTRRGHYQLNAGSLYANTTTIGGADTAGGSFVQTGGVASLGTVVMNVDSTSNAVLSLSGGSLTFASLLNNGTYAQSGGVASTIGKIDGGGVISVTGTGSLTTARIRQDAVNIGGDGRIKIIIPSTPLVSPANRVQSLTIEQAGSTVRGSWDLGPQTLIIDYDGASPIADIRRYLASGYAGGSWNGTGLASSAAAADAGRRTALGYAEALQLFGAAGGVYDGVFVDASSIVVALTFYGDANLDGAVNLQDFNRFAANFGQANASWFGGDFNYDGIVNLADFNRLAANFGLSAGADGVVDPGDWAALAAAVPEPSVMCLTSIVLLARRARRTTAPRAKDTAPRAKDHRAAHWTRARSPCDAMVCTT